MIFGVGRSSGAFTVAQLRAVLDGLQAFSVAAGAKAAAKDLQIFSDMLRPYAGSTVTAFCADTSAKLQAASAKPKGGKRATAARPRAASNEGAIRQYIADLRDAGIDRSMFDAVFARLNADKSLKAADVGEIARQYANSVTKYKSMAAARDDISKAFVRQARFENKLR
jgi:hypothetical protein